SVEIPIENDKGLPIIDKKDHIKESAIFTKCAAITIDEEYENIIIRMYNVNIDEAENKDLSEPFEPLKLTLHFTDEHEEQNLPDAEKKSRRGYTKMWMIGKDFKAKECSSIEINDGGIIQFISGADDSTLSGADDFTLSGANDFTLYGADDFTLILLKGNGIYKHSLRYLSNDMKFYHKVLPLNYPERIIHALKYNCGEYVMTSSENLENLDKLEEKLEEKLENKYFTILNIRPFFDEENQIAWDKLVLSEHLTRSGPDSGWRELTPSESNITSAKPNAYGIEEEFSLLDLEESELKYYYGTEPWAVHPAEKIIDTYIKVPPSFSRHVIYLDKEKTIRLLIGNNTIQVWRGKKLEFIHIVNDNPEEPEEPHENNRNESTNDSEKCITRILSVISTSDNESNSENDIKTKLKKVKNIIVKHSLSHKKIEQERPLHSWQVPLKEIFPDEEAYGFFARKESPDANVDIDEIDFIWTKPEKA
ncbi:10539_t:CDS:2, partial [Racocetra fulgida]